MKDEINRKDLEPSGASSYVFEGDRYGATSLSLHLTDLVPGQGPPLHRHPYEESMKAKPPIRWARTRWR
jgi:hypothetical protein